MLSDLIERVRAATGPDRELDVLIVQVLFPDIGECQPHCIGDEPIFWNDPFYKQECPRLTFSLDAAKSFTERVLPGWSGCVSFGVKPGAVVYDKPYPHTAIEQDVEAPTPALALVLSTLLAKQAQEATHG